MELFKESAFFLGCLIVGLAGAFGYLFFRKRFDLMWHQASKFKKLPIVCAAFALVVVFQIALNFFDKEPTLGIRAALEIASIGLVFLGCYIVFSRVVDRVWARFSRK
jgi:hypothetical protein